MYNLQKIQEILKAADRAIMLSEQGVSSAPFGGASGTALFNNPDFLVLLWMTIWQTEQFGSGSDESINFNFMDFITNSTNGGNDIGPANINFAAWWDGTNQEGDPHNPTQEQVAQWREAAATPAGTMQVMIGYFTRYAFRRIPENATPQQVMEACYAVWLRGPKGHLSPNWGETANQGMKNMLANFERLMSLYMGGQSIVQDILELYADLSTYIEGYITPLVTPKPNLPALTPQPPARKPGPASSAGSSQ